MSDNINTRNFSVETGNSSSIEEPNLSCAASKTPAVDRLRLRPAPWSNDFAGLHSAEELSDLDAKEAAEEAADFEEARKCLEAGWITREQDEEKRKEAADHQKNIDFVREHLVNDIFTVEASVSKDSDGRTRIEIEESEEDTVEFKEAEGYDFHQDGERIVVYTPLELVQAQAQSAPVEWQEEADHEKNVSFVRDHVVNDLLNVKFSVCKDSDGRIRIEFEDTEEVTTIEFRKAEGYDCDQDGERAVVYTPREVVQAQVQVQAQAQAQAQAELAPNRKRKGVHSLGAVGTVGRRFQESVEAAEPATKRPKTEPVSVAAPTTQAGRVLTPESSNNSKSLTPEPAIATAPTARAVHVPTPESSTNSKSLTPEPARATASTARAVHAPTPESSNSPKRPKKQSSSITASATSAAQGRPPPPASSSNPKRPKTGPSRFTAPAPQATHGGIGKSKSASPTTRKRGRPRKRDEQHCCPHCEWRQDRPSTTGKKGKLGNKRHKCVWCVIVTEIKNDPSRRLTPEGRREVQMERKLFDKVRIKAQAATNVAGKAQEESEAKTEVAFPSPPTSTTIQNYESGPESEEE